MLDKVVTWNPSRRATGKPGAWVVITRPRLARVTPKVLDWGSPSVPRQAVMRDSPRAHSPAHGTMNPMSTAAQTQLQAVGWVAQRQELVG